MQRVLRHIKENTMNQKKPFEDTRLAQYVERRILELKSRKTQGEIAAQAGFINPNVITIIKQGKTKAALDRIGCQTLANRTVELKRPTQSLRGPRQGWSRWRCLAMCGIDAASGLALQLRMAGDQLAILVDQQFCGVILDLERPAPSGVRDGIEVATNRDHPVLAHPALHRQHGAVRDLRERRQMGNFLGKGVINHAPGGGVNARIGHLGPPGVELAVEIGHVPERASQEEVLPDIAEWALDLALGLGPIRLAGARHRAVMVQQRHQGGIVGHHNSLILADHGGLHPVIEVL